MKKLLPGAFAALLVLAAIEIASAASVIAFATRTDSFTRDNAAAVFVPLRNNDTVGLQFETTAPNTTVVIIYNAECVVSGPRGVQLAVRIQVDGADTLPDSGNEAVLCSAIDTAGASWVSAARQAVVKIPEAGAHVVKVRGRLIGGTGTWRLDDSSIVVQRALGTFATRQTAHASNSADPVNLPLQDNGARLLAFSTAAANEKIKLTYNAECGLAANNAESTLLGAIFVDDATPRIGPEQKLCGAVDAMGQTLVSTIAQRAVQMPGAGTHVARLRGNLETTGNWRVDDTSFVITRGYLAASQFVGSLAGNSTDEIQLPIAPGPDNELVFETTEANQVVKLSFRADCSVKDDRGRWYALWITVDNVDAAPSSGPDFALCSSVSADASRHHGGFRQSVFVVPMPGTHTARVFGQISERDNPPVHWSIVNPSLIVE
jgi:hypothetical protein